MNRKLTFAKYYFLWRIRQRFLRSDEQMRNYFQKGLRIHNKAGQDAVEINDRIYSLIQSNKPFMVGRLGGNELSAVKHFDFETKSKYSVSLEYLCNNAGFFPNSIEAGKRFKELMLQMIPEADILGLALWPFEDYYLERYGNKALCTTHILDLEPWIVDEKPWTSALEGKKVLVISPFAETICKQYLLRESIFPGTTILPEFELHVLKAVQTVAGEKDERFDTWFDALEWMYQEALKIDFDVAIIGCGAYGFPLAAKLKQAGKQSIQLGGATQLLFGIKGKRWVENDSFAYIQRYFNDKWVYPSEAEKPKNASDVEGACYW